MRNAIRYSRICAALISEAADSPVLIMGMRARIIRMRHKNYRALDTHSRIHKYGVDAPWLDCSVCKDILLNYQSTTQIFLNPRKSQAKVAISHLISSHDEPQPH